MSTLWQGDKRWSGIQLGHGPGRIGKSGCLLTCLTEAARVLAHRPGLLPPHANELLRGVPGAFVAAGSDIPGDSLVVEVAAKALGMESPQRERETGAPGSVVLRDALEAAFSRGYAIVHVDHNGIDGGDHFLLALKRSEDGTVDCIDPALARHVPLAWPGLDTHVMWGKHPKIYRVVAVRPLRPLAV